MLLVHEQEPLKRLGNDAHRVGDRVEQRVVAVALLVSGGGRVDPAAALRDIARYIVERDH